MIDDPLGIFIEYSRRVLVNKRQVSLLQLLLHSGGEESSSNCHEYFLIILSRAQNVEFVPLHDRDKLLSNILCMPHTSCLDEILETTRVPKFCKQQEVSSGLLLPNGILPSSCLLGLVCIAGNRMDSQHSTEM